MWLALVLPGLIFQFFRGGLIIGLAAELAIVLVVLYLGIVSGDDDGWDPLVGCAIFLVFEPLAYLAILLVPPTMSPLGIPCIGVGCLGYNGPLVGKLTDLQYALVCLPLMFSLGFAFFLLMFLIRTLGGWLPGLVGSLAALVSGVYLRGGLDALRYGGVVVVFLGVALVFLGVVGVILYAAGKMGEEDAQRVSAGKPPKYWWMFRK